MDFDETVSTLNRILADEEPSTFSSSWILKYAPQCISLVRLAQNGNQLAKQEAVKLVRYTIDDWIARYHFMSRWEGYEEEIQKHLEACIRRYRYTGSFLKCLFRTLEYAGRGLRPLYRCSLHDPVAYGSRKYKIENVYKDDETNEIRLHTG